MPDNYDLSSEDEFFVSRESHDSESGDFTESEWHHIHETHTGKPEAEVEDSGDVIECKCGKKMIVRLTGEVRGVSTKNEQYMQEFWCYSCGETSPADSVSEKPDREKDVPRWLKANAT